jgi:hypothetical protein
MKRHFEAGMKDEQPSADASFDDRERYQGSDRTGPENAKGIEQMTIGAFQ